MRFKVVLPVSPHAVLEAGAADTTIVWMREPSQGTRLLLFVIEEGQRPARILCSILRGVVDPRILGKDTSCSHVWKGHFQLWFTGGKRPPN